VPGLSVCPLSLFQNYPDACLRSPLPGPLPQHAESNFYFCHELRGAHSPVPTHTRQKLGPSLAWISSPVRLKTLSPITGHVVFNKVLYKCSHMVLSIRHNNAATSVGIKLFYVKCLNHKQTNAGCTQLPAHPLSLHVLDLVTVGRLV
jgi:hypothetical protein